MRDLRVRDVMQKDIFCATIDMPVKDFVAECVRRRITGAPVVDHQEELVGVISLSDVAVALNFPKPNDTGLVGALMTTPPHTVGPSTNLQKAADLFIRHRVHRLVVSYQKHVLGLVSPVDLLAVSQEKAVTF